MRVLAAIRSACLPACVLAAGALLAVEPGPRPRPPEWADPMLGVPLENCFRVSDELYRSEQPATGDIPALHAMGVKSVLNLRNHHRDAKAFAAGGFTVGAAPMRAGRLTVDDLVAALREFRRLPKPVVVHCWHGSDRTGSVVAAYRIVFQDWTPAAALDELRHGGFGYHETWFPNIVSLFESLDAADLRRRVLADPNASASTSSP